MNSNANNFYKLIYTHVQYAPNALRLSQNCTAGHGFILDLDFFTRVGVRRYLNSNANNFYKLIYTHVQYAPNALRLSQNCTAGHGFILDLDFFTRAGVRRYLNSNANNLKKLIYTYIRMCDVHKTERAVHGPFSARLWSVQYPFQARSTAVLLKRSGVKRTVHGRVFLVHTVLPEPLPLIYYVASVNCAYMQLYTACDH